MCQQSHGAYFPSRKAYLLAGAFNFQGKVKKTFFVLTDDKIGSGPHLKPGVLSKKPATEKQDCDSPMETDADVEDVTPKQPAPTTLAAKLAAQSSKRKADETLGSDSGFKAVKTKRK